MWEEGERTEKSDATAACIQQGLYYFYHQENEVVHHQNTHARVYGMHLFHKNKEPLLMPAIELIKVRL